MVCLIVQYFLKHAANQIGFMMPSLASIFPFLESIRPKEIPTWHISRAQVLHHYDCAWVLQSENARQSDLTLISLGHEHASTETPNMDNGTYFLILFPRLWNSKEVGDKWMVICNQAILLGEAGCLITRSEFEKI